MKSPSLGSAFLPESDHSLESEFGQITNSCDFCFKHKNGAPLQLTNKVKKLKQNDIKGAFQCIDNLTHFSAANSVKSKDLNKHIQKFFLIWISILVWILITVRTVIKEKQKRKVKSTFGLPQSNINDYQNIAFADAALSNLPDIIWTANLYQIPYPLTENDFSLELLIKTLCAEESNVNLAKYSIYHLYLLS